MGKAVKKGCVRERQVMGMMGKGEGCGLWEEGED